MAPSLWENMKNNCSNRHLKDRFLGTDVNMKWTQSDEELQSFLSRTNNLHPSIKFTHEIYSTTISLLDTSSLSEGEQSTDLYPKHTDTNQFLFV